jgi:hypothetical protein
MNLPGFNAEASLYGPAATYQVFGAIGATGGNVRPQQIQVPDVALPLDICPRGSINACLRMCNRIGGSANDIFLCGFACRFLCTGP